MLLCPLAVSAYDVPTSDCICGKIAKKMRPPEKEKNIAVMPAEFIGKACCGGDKKWGDGRTTTATLAANSFRKCRLMTTSITMVSSIICLNRWGMRSLAVCVSCAAVVVCACMRSLGVPAVVEVRKSNT